MKKELSDALNKLFSETYNNIGRYEDTVLQSMGKDIPSLSEFHIIECIAEAAEDGRTIGEIAQHMHVTLPTITVAIQKLVKKGFVTKHRSDTDRRLVLIRLTRKGQKMNSAHRYFHRKIAHDIAKKFSDDEVAVLIKCMGTINNTFNSNREKIEEKAGALL